MIDFSCISPAEQIQSDYPLVSLLYQKGRGLPRLSGSRPRDRRVCIVGRRCALLINKPIVIGHDCRSLRHSATLITRWAIICSGLASLALRESVPRRQAVARRPPVRSEFYRAPNTHLEKGIALYKPEWSRSLAFRFGFNCGSLAAQLMERRRSASSSDHTVLGKGAAGPRRPCGTAP
jgi:hypothetical protein